MDPIESISSAPPSLAVTFVQSILQFFFLLLETGFFSYFQFFSQSRFRVNWVFSFCVKAENRLKSVMSHVLATF